MAHEIFTKEALRELDGKKLPLVVYYGGERRVVGEAVLSADRRGIFADFSVTDEGVDAYLKESTGRLIDDHQP